MKIFLMILISIMFLIGIFILQIFLSKRENKWLGLILPIINVIFSIKLGLGVVLKGGESIKEIIMETILVFLVWNISTGFLFDIYFSRREKLEKNKEIDKMNIQDLH
ncbi:MAG: hypothetical protein ACI8WT_001089 [Clostridium sp.]|jgi:hypothetical protein